jgi:hypothetical protein
MTPDERKATTRRWILGIWDQGSFGLIEELPVPDRYACQVPGQEALRGQSFHDFVCAVRAAFPDLRNTIESQVAEGDMVVTRGTTRPLSPRRSGGTHCRHYPDADPSPRSAAHCHVL